MALLTRPELAELRGPSYTVSGALAVWCGLSRLAPRCLARRVSQGAASSPEEGSIAQGNQSGGEVELSDKLAAVELTKFMVGLRADRMTDQDIFALYRECLRVIGESETAAPAETDPQKIATALMAIFNAEKPKKRPANRQPKLKIRRHKRGT